MYELTKSPQHTALFVLFLFLAGLEFVTAILIKGPKEKAEISVNERINGKMASCMANIIVILLLVWGQ